MTEDLAAEAKRIAELALHNNTAPKGPQDECITCARKGGEHQDGCPNLTRRSEDFEEWQRGFARGTRFDILPGSERGNYSKTFILGLEMAERDERIAEAEEWDEIDPPPWANRFP